MFKCMVQLRLWPLAPWEGIMHLKGKWVEARWMTCAWHVMCGGHLHGGAGGPRRVGDMGDDVDGGVDDAKDARDL